MTPVKIIIPWTGNPTSLFETNEFGDLFPVQSRFDQIYDLVIQKLYNQFAITDNEMVDVEVEYAGDPVGVEDVSLLMHMVLYMLWRGNVIETRGMKNIRSIKCTVISGPETLVIKVSE